MKRALAVAVAFGMLTALPRLHVSEAEAAPAPQAVTLKACPALLYIEYDLPGPTGPLSRPSVATFETDPPTIVTVMQSQWVYAQRLSDSAFLLRARESPAAPARWTQAYYLADFGSGKVRPLSQSVSRDRSVYFDCLRMAAAGRPAVLMRYGQGTEETTLLTVDPSTLEAKPYLTLNLAAGERGSTGRLSRLSPDLRHAAIMTSPRDPQPGLPTHCSLDVLDLRAGTTKTLVDDVMTGPNALTEMGWREPPCEWLNDREILYQDVVPRAEGERFRPKTTCVLKSVDIDTGHTEEWLRREFDLSSGPGSMGRDPFTEQLLWGEFVVDEEQRTIAPYDPGYRLAVGGAEGTTLRFGGQVLYHNAAADYDVHPLPSRSHTHLAYYRRAQDAASSAIHVATRDGDRFQIPSLSRDKHLVAWIEGGGTPTSRQTATTPGH